MSRIRSCFERLRAQGRKALIPYVTAGDSDPAITVPLMHRMVEAGADIIELGVPFSDPMADGPVIQRASERALEKGTSLHDVLDMVKQFREDDSETPVVLMGYLNPIEVMGYAEFARAAAEVGVDGALTVDLPPEEGTEMHDVLLASGLDPIFLLAPTSNAERIRKICNASSGYVYYVSLKGITGAGHLDLDSVADKLQEIRQYTDLPVGVGFGIKDAETASRMGRIADAVIVGSAIVTRIEEHADQPDAAIESVASFVAELRQGLDA
jgi:tryptophan synthase alpha chain